MPNFKQNKIERFASETLAKTLLETPNYHFTNTSYCCAETVLGTIKMEKPSEEHYIQMVLKRDGDYSSSTYNLVKSFEDTYYKTPTQEYSKQNHEEIVATYYKITGDVYSTDKQEAIDAYSKAVERSKFKTYRCYGHRSRTRIVQPHTKLYDSLFVACSKERQIKYGAELKYEVYENDIYRYEDGEKIGYTGITTTVYYTYRNKIYSVKRYKTTYKNPKAEY